MRYRAFTVLDVTVGRFQAATDGRSYELLVRPEPGPSPWGKVNCGE
jgi:hypothetical protein